MQASDPTKVRDSGISAEDFAAADEPYPPAPRAWAAVVLLMIFYLASMLDKNIVALLGESIAKDLSLNDRQLGLLFGPAFALCYALGALPAGWSMDRYSRRWVLWCGMMIWSIGMLFGGLWRGFAQLFISRAIVGAGESVLVPGNQSIIADMFPPDRMALPFGVCSLGVKLGQGFSFLIGGLLITAIAPGAIFAIPALGEFRGWQLILVVLALPNLLLALLVFLIPEPARRKVRSPEAYAVGYRDYFAYVRQNGRFFLGVHLGGITAVMVSSSLMVWTPAHFIRAHGMSASEAGLWLGIVLTVASLVALPVHGIIADRLFRRGMADAHGRWLAWSVGLSVIPLTAAFLVPDLWLGFLLLGIGDVMLVAFAILGPTVIQMMLPGELRGKAASGLLVATSIGGMAFGPLITATISDVILKDPNQIGTALAIYAALVLPLAGLFYRLTMKPLRIAYPAPPTTPPLDRIDLTPRRRTV